MLQNMIYLLLLLVSIYSLISAESDSCHQLRCDMERAYITCDVFWSEKFCSQVPISDKMKRINPNLQLSCPMHDECAYYLLGTKGELGLSPVPGMTLQNCPGYPPLGETYLAPSICLNEFLSAASIIQYSIAVFNQTGKFAAMQNFLSTDMAENCLSSCFLNYQWKAIDYFNQCFDDLVEGAQAGVILDVPFLKLASNQQFRGQACQSKTTVAESSTIDNCYMNFLGGVAALAPTIDVSASIPYTCDGALDETKADAICNKVFGGSRTQCCSGATTSFFLQQTVNATFPPCLNEYLTKNCPNYNPDVFCENGVLSPINTLTGSTTITTTDTNTTTLPNVYDEGDVKSLRVAIGNAVVPEGFIPNTPAGKAMTVTITQFEYIDASGAVIPSSFGSTSDYSGGTAVSLRLTYQVTIGWTAYVHSQDNGTPPSNGDVTTTMIANNNIVGPALMQFFPGNTATSTTTKTNFVQSDEATSRYNSGATTSSRRSIIISSVIGISVMLLSNLF